MSYTFPYTFTNGTVADATQVMANFNVALLGINSAIARDGTALVTADIPFAGYKLTGVGTPAIGTDGANKGYVDTSVASVSSGMLNAKQAPFNAKGDGVTDDSTALNAFFAALYAQGGGTGIIPEGTYVCNSAINAPAAAFNRTTILSAGARIKPTHNSSTLLITGGSAGWGGMTIMDMVIDIQGNTTVQRGFDNMGAVCTVLVNCSIEYDVPNPSGFIPFLFRNFDKHDDNTGSFWCRVLGGSCRQRSGALPRLSDVIAAWNQANDLQIKDFSFQDADNGILVQPEAGTTSNANGLLIDGCAFEGLSYGVWFEMDATGAPDGLRVVNNRVEVITNSFLRFTGTGYGGQQHPFFAGNAFAVFSVAQYIDCVAGMNYTSLDSALGAPVIQTGMARFTHNKPFQYRSDTNTQDLVEFYAPVGFGTRWFEQSGGTNIAALTARSGSGATFGGAAAGNLLYASYVAGVSSTGTEARNLCGTRSFAGTTSAVVAFPANEADASYFVQLTPSAVNGGVWVTGKGTTGFTINFNAAFTGTVDWFISR